ncbi:MAG: lipocalin family protein, partial [Bdellovibrionales bacterium]|nr:lipocalin family protein [Bdellovibrionales bacterium]
ARSYYWAKVSIDGLDNLSKWFDAIDDRPLTQKALTIPKPYPAFFGKGDIEKLEAENAERTAVGVPNGSYLWIMAREWDFSKDKVKEILKKLDGSGYPINDIKYVPQKWN